MEYQEEDYLLLSGIQHFAFCRRQWALIHIEQQWQENVRTFEESSCMTELMILIFVRNEKAY